MRSPLFEVIGKKILLGDGAMGTMLQSAGLKSGECGELWNIEAPDKVIEIQGRYAAAGSDMILTNTFGGSAVALRRHKLDGRTIEVNEAAAKIARQVVGEDRYVIGDIGPFGGMLEPYGDAEPDDVLAGFLEQARGLLRGGVDALIVETQTALEELELGVKAAQQALREAGLEGKLPIIGSMAFDHAASGPPKTMMGVDPERAAETMVELGVDILACNCGTKLDINSYTEIVRIYRKVAPDKPVMAQPNAGQPEMEGGKIVYRETPEMMAAGVKALVDAGAVIVGGCCGTTPEHMACFRKEIDGINAAR